MFWAKAMKRAIKAICTGILGCTIGIPACAPDRTQYADNRMATFSVTGEVAQVKAFRLYERQKENSDWNDGSPLDEKKAREILAALEGSKVWDHKSHAAVYSPWDTQPPPIGLGLAWSTDLQDEAKSVWICYGNRLFWWKDSLYQVSDGKEKVLDRHFPKNK